MTLRTTGAALAAALFLLPAAAPAADITVADGYARAASPAAASGAAFMAITNAGETPDTLVAASSDVAERVELHTHVMEANGVMRMVELEEGLAIAPGETALLARGGDHVMLMGLRRPLEQGDTVTVTLTFENAGDLTVEIPVDLERAP